MKDPGIYKGIYSTGQLPGNIVHKEEAYTKKVHGRIVTYWKVWVGSEGHPLTSFSDEKIEQSKIYLVERSLGIKFNKPKR